MRSYEEQGIALQCVSLAQGDVEHARRIYAFVTGEDEESAEDRLRAVFAAIKAFERPASR